MPCQKPIDFENDNLFEHDDDNDETIENFEQKPWFDQKQPKTASPTTKHETSIA